MGYVKVRYNAANVLFFGDLRLLPGINKIRGELYDHHSRSPKWQSRVKSGLISVVEDDREVEVKKVNTQPKPEKKPKRAAGRPKIDDIIAEINDTFSLDAVKEFLSHKNEQVRAAAEARLVVIGPSPVVSDEETTEPELELKKEMPAPEKAEKPTKRRGRRRKA
jgi:hypothetical protein